MEIGGYYPQTNYSLGPRIVFQTLKPRRNSNQTFHSKQIPTLFKVFETKTLEASAIFRTYQGIDADRGTTRPWFGWLGDMAKKSVYIHAYWLPCRNRSLRDISRHAKALGSTLAILWQGNLVWKAGHRSQGFRLLPFDNIVMNPIRELPRPAFTGTVSSRDIKGEPWGGASSVGSRAENQADK